MSSHVFDVSVSVLEVSVVTGRRFLVESADAKNT